VKYSSLDFTNERCTELKHLKVWLAKIPWEYSASNIVERAEKFPGALQGLPRLRTCANIHAIGFLKDIGEMNN